MLSLETWYAEIVSDLEAARMTLAANLEALATAEAAALAAKRERRALSEAVARIGPHPTLAGALHWRVREHDAALMQVDAGAARARNDVKTNHASIRDLEDALRQLAAMMPPETPAAEPALIQVLA